MGDDPRMTTRGLALIAAASLAPAAGAMATPFPDHLIRPGVGAGGVRLGMSEGQVLKVLGQPDKRVPRQTELGAFIDLAWPGITVSRWDGAGGRVVNIAITDRGIRMRNGVGVGSTRTAVTKALPGADCDESPRLCMVGEAIPGNTVTTIRFGRTNRVTEVSVGRVID